MTPQSALPPEVVRLRDQAEAHKRNEGRQRRAARRTTAELREVCAALGIDFKEVKRDRGQKGQSREDSSA